MKQYFRSGAAWVFTLSLWMWMAVAQPAPQIYEEFNGWTGVMSPDGVWRRNGNWTATGNNLFLLDNCIVSSTYNGQPGGYLDLVVNANVLQGGEIQTYGTVGSNLGYGYYEVQMMPGVPSCCVSFFWKQVNYGPGEIDIEFLTNEVGSRAGKVHYTVHPDGDTYIQSFSFGAYKEFHRYGFLWKADRITYTIDGHVTHTFSSPQTAIPNTKGYIMMNAWTGTPGWGEGPPPIDVHSVYDWVKLWPGLSEVPDDSSTTGGIILGEPQVHPSCKVRYPHPVRSLADIRFLPEQGQVCFRDLTGRPTGRFTYTGGRIRERAAEAMPGGVYLLEVEGSGESRTIVLAR